MTDGFKLIQLINVLVVQRFGVGHVIERSLVRLLAGVLSSQLGQLSLPSLLGRKIEYQPAWLRLGGVCSLVSSGGLHRGVIYGKWRPIALRWGSHEGLYRPLPLHQLITFNTNTHDTHSRNQHHNSTPPIFIPTRHIHNTISSPLQLCAAFQNSFPCSTTNYWEFKC